MAKDRESFIRRYWAPVFSVAAHAGAVAWVLFAAAFRPEPAAAPMAIEMTPIATMAEASAVQPSDMAPTPPQVEQVQQTQPLTQVAALTPPVPIKSAEPPPPEPMKVEPPPPEPTKLEPRPVEPVKPEPIKEERVKPEPVKPEEHQMVEAVDATEVAPVREIEEPPPPPPVKPPVVRAQPQPQSQRRPPVAQPPTMASAPAPAMPSPAPAVPSYAPSASPAPAAMAAPTVSAPSPTWLATVRAKLERNKVYPDSARARRQEGTATIRFVVNREGQILSYAIVKSSGVSLLDDATEDMVRRASPVPPMPADMPNDRLELTIPVMFGLR